jgi:hypothetical protein
LKVKHFGNEVKKSFIQVSESLDLRIEFFQLVQGEFLIVQMIFGDKHEEVSHVFVHDDFGDEESFAVEIQKVDKFFELIELFYTDLKGLFHMLVLESKFVNEFLQIKVIEVVFLWSFSFDLEVNFMVLVAVIFKLDEIAKLQIDGSL